MKVYLTVWFWLFVLSFSAYFIDLLNLPFAFKAILLVAVALMKAGLIVAYFLHLKFEKLNLVYAILLPLILFIALAAGILPDGLSALLSQKI